MHEAPDLLIRGATCLLPDGEKVADVAVRDGIIADVGDMKNVAAPQIVDAGGLHLLPGLIDTQVHFREPGNEHKEDLESGSRAAVKGGITAVFEMPNTAPPTTTAEALEDKLRRARDRMFCHYAFYVGASEENADRLGELERHDGCCGVKIFMGSSTGNLLVADDRVLAQVLACVNRRPAIHAEDEARLDKRKNKRQAGNPDSHRDWRDEKTALLATQRIVSLAQEAGKKVHILHVSTAEEMAFLADQKDTASVEVTPQHLTLAAPDCYRRLGTFAQMNPPIRDERHRQALWRAVQDGIADIIGSDHAPHSREEKNRSYPETPSGMPGVQTLVPVMLDHVNAGRLSLRRFVEMTCTTPVRLFGIKNKGAIAPGYDADFTLVDLKARREITDRWIESRCGWTPFAGYKVTGWPVMTVIAGRPVMRDDEIIGQARGKPVVFDR